MNRQEKVILLGLAVLAVAGGAVKVKLEADASTGVDTKTTVNVALKQGLVDATTPRLSYNNWTASEHQLMSVGVKPLRDNHSLFRRPRFIGENRHKVMTEGWGGWYYNPPGEDYF